MIMRDNYSQLHSANCWCLPSKLHRVDLVFNPFQCAVFTSHLISLSNLGIFPEPFSSTKVKERGAGAITQMVQCLLSKNEDVSLIPNIQI